MACVPTPTATLFGTTLVPTVGLSTVTITQVQSVIVDGFILITVCVPPPAAATSATCVPSVSTSRTGGVSLITSFITSVQTVSSVQTITSPTRTLFATSCPDPVQDTPTVTTTTTLPPSEAETVTPPTPTPTPTSTPTSTSTSTSTTGYVAPVTLTRTLTSTDPSGNIVVATVATVSTPSPDSTQSGAGSGDPNTPAIVGGVVGGLVGLAALIGIIWYIMYKKSSGRWDDIWEEDEGHQAGVAEVKPGRPGDDGSSPNPYVYGVVGRGTPSPLHSRTVSTATGYADHGRSNSQTPLMLSTSPPHSPPTSPPSLQPSQLPGAGAGLERMRTPIWANPSAQQGYYQQGYPPIPSDTYSTTSTSRTTSATASSNQGLLSGYVAPTHTAATPAAYPPGAAAPVIGGRRSTYNEYHKPPLEQSEQAAAPHQQTAPSGSTTNLVDAPIDNSAKSPPKTSLVSVSPGPPKTSNPARIVEDAPPAYQQ